MMGLTAGLAAGGRAGWAAPPTAPADKAVATATPPTRDRLGQLLPQRQLGRTGQWVTALGLGGSHLINAGQSEKESQALIEAALEEGVRFFDTAQQYGRGKSETRYGQLLTPRYRDISYVMTKTQARERGRALQDVDECRQRLNVDVIDLMQIHHIESPAEVDKLVDGGVVDVLLKARDQGKIRHLGFTGHDTPHAHLRMLERLEQLGIDFDTMQMPMNVVDPHYESFILNVLPKAIERGYGVLAMKTLAFGQLIGQDNGWGGRDRLAPAIVPQQMNLAEALGFVWSLPIATLISGMPTVDMVRENAQIARGYVALSEDQRLALIDKVADSAGPRVEFYKTQV